MNMVVVDDVWTRNACASSCHHGHAARARADYHLCGIGPNVVEKPVGRGEHDGQRSEGDWAGGKRFECLNNDMYGYHSV